MTCTSYAGYSNSQANGPLCWIRQASSSSKPPTSSNARRVPRKTARLGKSPLKSEDAILRQALLSQPSKGGQNKTSVDGPKPSRPTFADATPPTPKPAQSFPGAIKISKEELDIQKSIVKQRRKLLWPGIWTLFALTGTFSTLAYLSARFPPHPEQVSHHAELPQDWWLTPTIIREGLKAGWDGLDKLTIGIVVTTVLVHLLKKSPLPIWEKLIHITGEKRYTAFTYPFVHLDWSHAGMNTLFLVWFLPDVVRYFDGDTFHAAAFWASPPLITSFLQHFSFRFGWTSGIPMNVGSSGAVAAIFGAYCMLYPDEKIWLPALAVLRLNAKYWGAYYVLMQMLPSKPGQRMDRPAIIVS